ncbi:hypothetical protein HYPSUDRAFT_60208 [Hypholoma sublateritium FD-334 SS-4]|uniref:Uncharacterized protein n=1 Tax=Hypholoma sublateritium (strain FD-334 SS-4) TaxID=945553 RepID=A0A0D2N7U5_HYPSF|nr:hypothetical protein HYPSUDRAFT_60208 [Hypholoma sublateritium FD-334 SS-4]
MDAVAEEKKIVKDPTACVECAKRKQKCEFPPLEGAEKDAPKPKSSAKKPAAGAVVTSAAKPKSKRAAKVKKSPSEVPSSADEDDGQRTPQPVVKVTQRRAKEAKEKDTSKSKTATPKPAPHSHLIPRNSLARPKSKAIPLAADHDAPQHSAPMDVDANIGQPPVDDNVGQPLANMGQAPDVINSDQPPHDDATRQRAEELRQLAREEAAKAMKAIRDDRRVDATLADNMRNEIARQREIAEAVERAARRDRHVDDLLRREERRLSILAAEREAERLAEEALREEALIEQTNVAHAERALEQWNQHQWIPTAATTLRRLAEQAKARDTVPQPPSGAATTTAFQQPPETRAEEEAGPSGPHTVPGAGDVAGPPMPHANTMDAGPSSLGTSASNSHFPPGPPPSTTSNIAPRPPQQYVLYFLSEFQRAADRIEDQIGSNFNRLKEEMWAEIDILRADHKRELEEFRASQLAEREIVMLRYNELEERVTRIEDHLLSHSRELAAFGLDLHGRMHALDERQTVRTDLAYRTMFRHLEGYEGVIERWSARLARIEARVKLPIGAISDYQVMNTDEYAPGDYEMAARLALDTEGPAPYTADPLPMIGINPMESKMLGDLTTIMKRAYVREPGNAATPVEQPAAGPSTFPGSYVPPAGDVDVDMKPSTSDATANVTATTVPGDMDVDGPTDKPSGHVDSDEVEFVGDIVPVQSPRKSDNEIEFVGGIVQSPRKADSSASRRQEPEERPLPADQPVIAPTDESLPTVNVIPPTPSNSQPVDTEKPSTVAAEPTSQPVQTLPAGPPATRTRGRSRANSTQPVTDHASTALGQRQVASAEPSRRGRQSRSPAPAMPPS